MIAVHREYCLSNSPDLHAHVEVNPVGKLEVEIVELQERHITSLKTFLLKVAVLKLEFAVKKTRFHGNLTLPRQMR
ncbi:hypothetical protein ACOMICROBIO_LMKGKHOH_04731 [Vibrio sp. B1FIG11]|nr:hypothetical protein ACOMICROBIO_LMKGKHOH_04731 [Vibrio sp. B1FIG11]CAE6943651.1 hypothetical protein ACOMICROBIO_LMKGKHOH_04731 [Vibrio sp. B1FIG11]